MILLCVLCLRLEHIFYLLRTKPNRLRKPRGREQRRVVRRFLIKSWKRITDAFHKPRVDPNPSILDDFIIVDWEDTSSAPSR